MSAAPGASLRRRGRPVPVGGGVLDGDGRGHRPGWRRPGLTSVPSRRPVRPSPTPCRVRASSRPGPPATCPTTAAPSPCRLLFPSRSDGQPSVVVGDRYGDVYAYNLGGSSAVAVPGWPATNESGPIDSTPSVADVGGQPSVLVGSGNDGDPIPGGYTSYGPSGNQQWFTSVVNPPSDTAPAGGVQAGIAVGFAAVRWSRRRGRLARPGLVRPRRLRRIPADRMAVPQHRQHPLHRGSGRPLRHRPERDHLRERPDRRGRGPARSTPTAATSGSSVPRGTRSAGPTPTRWWTRPRPWAASSPAEPPASWSAPATSSPGPRTPTRSRPTTTGASCSGRPPSTATPTRRRPSPTSSATARCRWWRERTLGVNGGSVWVLDAATGQKSGRSTASTGSSARWSPPTSATPGYDDVIVPTIARHTGPRRADREPRSPTSAPTSGLQNSPLVTDDPNGDIGITLAGYTSSTLSATVVGEIDHYEISGSDGAAAVSGSAWPMFHHDPQLTGNAGGTTPVGSVPRVLGARRGLLRVRPGRIRRRHLHLRLHALLRLHRR